MRDEQQNNRFGDDMFFSWKEEYSVGIDTIDLQHRLLINMINDLYLAIHENRSSEVLPSLLGRLQNYILEHFSTEKRMMEEAGYQGLREHLLEHDEMVDKVDELESKYVRGRLGSLGQLVVYLRSWLDHHICKTDKAMAQTLSGQGPQKWLR
jgi:hemerythrin